MCKCEYRICTATIYRGASITVACSLNVGVLINTFDGELAKTYSYRNESHDDCKISQNNLCLLERSNTQLFSVTKCCNITETTVYTD